MTDPTIRPNAFPPGSTIGILGGGQLGRMLALAAAEIGLKCHIYCPDEASPAFEVSARHTCAPYEDGAALAAFAATVDVVTYEFENVPAETVTQLEPQVSVRPGNKALEVAQDRLTEKTFLNGIGIQTAPFVAVDRPEAGSGWPFPGILKTRRFGYDGKGQTRVENAGDLAAAYEHLGGVPMILEGLVPFEREISVIAARGLGGEIACYDPIENVHRDHILWRSTVPAAIDPQVADEAKEMARLIVHELGYCGVIGVEMFLVPADAPGQRLLVNEIAPRVHNSGHWTQDACHVSQFQQHIRAVAGWPLGSPERHSDAVMTNLIGDEAADWETYAAEAQTAVHLYGKAEARPGRKMGHVTRIRPRGEAA